jgi:hypothetical protein
MSISKSVILMTSARLGTALSSKMNFKPLGNNPMTSIDFRGSRLNLKVNLLSAALW